MALKYGERRNINLCFRGSRCRCLAAPSITYTSPPLGEWKNSSIRWFYRFMNFSNDRTIVLDYFSWHFFFESSNMFNCSLLHQMTPWKIILTLSRHNRHCVVLMDISITCSSAIMALLLLITNQGFESSFQKANQLVWCHRNLTAINHLVSARLNPVLQADQLVTQKITGTEVTKFDDDFSKLEKASDIYIDLQVKLIFRFS